VNPLRFISSSRVRSAALLVLALALSACTGGYALAPRPAAGLTDTGAIPIAWLGPSIPGDADALARWRRSVGPPVVLQGRAALAPADRLVIVNWNTHVGGGDLARLFGDVQRAYGRDVPVVMLLQEAYRRGPEVPRAADGPLAFAAAIRAGRPGGERIGIRAAAGALGLHAYYVPSMRNGGPSVSDEDRGNAIVSTLPLTGLAALELPFERQRRVAVAATIEGTSSSGTPWRLRVVSAHLDNGGGLRRLWFAGGELGRLRQARGLVAALERESPLVLGADMNTWFGFRDSAYLAAARAFPDTVVTDRRPTFQGLLRLDHVFFRLPAGWTGRVERLDERYGSDHYPLVGTIELPPSSTLATK
jgi:endonuclease/exonuclease/phosphatase family metal-dependent hydrolase